MKYFDHILLSQTVRDLQKEIVHGIKQHEGVEHFKVAMDKTTTKRNVCAEAIIYEDPGIRRTMLADMVYKGNQNFAAIAWLIEKWVRPRDCKAMKTALS